MDALIAQLQTQEQLHTDAIQRFQHLHALVAEHCPKTVAGVDLEEVLTHVYEEAVAIVEQTGKNVLSRLLLAKIDINLRPHA